jgi:allantoicase
MQNDADEQAKKYKSVRLDRDKWLQLITEWEKSGESQKRFCERQGLNVNTFSYMKLQLKPKTKINKFKAFIPVISVPEKNKEQTDTITIENKNGIKLHVSLTLPIDRLTHLLNLLGWHHA